MTTTTTTEAFIAAAAGGDVGTVRAMLEAQPDLVDARSPSGERAIHAAYYGGHTDVCHFLFANGVQHDIFLASELGRYDDVQKHLDADPSLAQATRPGGATPLHMAVFWGHPKIAELLIDRGAIVTLNTGQSGFSPLHSAVAAPTTYSPGDQEDVVLETVELLLARGADVSARSHIGVEPLFTAAANGDLRVVQRLVAAGADPRVAAIDSAGAYANQRPVDIAEARGHTHVVEWLSPLS
jgi:ankyrin repeat protein